MSFHVTNRMGEMFSDPSAELIENVLGELDEPADDEHPDVSITHESGWCLSAFPSGWVVWEDLREGGPRHIEAVPRERVRRLWLALSVGDLQTIEAEPWRPGYH